MVTSTDLEIIRLSILFFSFFGLFGNFTIIATTMQNKSLRHKCGVLLMLLAVCDSTCLIHEFMSFFRMTFGNGQDTLRKCFWANIVYIFIEPFEVYLILVLAIDRILAIHAAISYIQWSHRVYVPFALSPGLVIAAAFLVKLTSILTTIFKQMPSYYGINDTNIETCALPFAMPDDISNYWNKYNLNMAILTMLVYLFTFISIHVSPVTNNQNINTQKAILNTIIVGAAVFCSSSTVSAALIAVVGYLENPPVDVETISTYAVIPGLLSYSCNFYVYMWRSQAYREAFIKQLCCGKVLVDSNKTSMGLNNSQIRRSTITVTVKPPPV